MFERSQQDMAYNGVILSPRNNVPILVSSPRRRDSVQLIMIDWKTFLTSHFSCSVGRAWLPVYGECMSLNNAIFG